MNDKISTNWTKEVQIALASLAAAIVTLFATVFPTAINRSDFYFLTASSSSRAEAWCDVLRSSGARPGDLTDCWTAASSYPLYM